MHLKCFHLYTFLCLPNFWQCTYTFLFLILYITQNAILRECGWLWYIVLLSPPQDLNMFPFLSLLVSLSSTLLLLSFSLNFSLLFHFFLPFLATPIPVFRGRLILKWNASQNVTSHQVGFKQILSASGVLRKVLKLGAGRWRARLLKRLVLDKINDGGELFRVTEAVGARAWGCCPGKREEQRVSYLVGSGDCSLPVQDLVRKDANFSWFELLDWISPGCIIDFDMWPLDLNWV